MAYDGHRRQVHDERCLGRGLRGPAREVDLGIDDRRARADGDRHDQREDGGAEEVVVHVLAPWGVRKPAAAQGAAAGGSCRQIEPMYFSSKACAWAAMRASSRTSSRLRAAAATGRST